MTFGNDSGSLTCENLPVGPYLKSCKKCSKSEEELRCFCSNSNGQAMETTIPLKACESFGNNDGALACHVDPAKAEL